MNYEKDLREVMILYPNLEVLSSSDYLDLINIHNLVKEALKKEDTELVEACFASRSKFRLNNHNDYFYLIFKTAIQKKGLKKVAYPNQEHDSSHSEFDIEKWSQLVYKIYDVVESGQMNLGDAVEYYSNTLSKKDGEPEKFKKWLQYYQSGEHLKYASKKSEIKKEGFQFPLSGPGFYGMDENPVLPEENSIKRVLEKPDSKDEYADWKTKLYSAIRRIDKLLRQGDEFLNSETQRDLADLLHQFDQEVRTLRHETTASDLAFRYANKFKKLGFEKGHQEFKKLSQEVVEEVPKPVETPKAEPETDDINTIKEKPDTGNSVQKSIQNAFSTETTAEPGEYEKLTGRTELADAIQKLEEITGRLSDRRTIRLLGELDIMLDKIGLAAMFPELSEAQSKLIDGYSYALTRVTKMLGMLSGGQAISEIAKTKKNEIANRTIKEVNKSIETANTPPEEPAERGAPAIQEGLEEQKPEVNTPPQPKV